MIEILYYWVECRENIKRQGFNFSPEFRCHMEVKDEGKYCLSIEATGKYNIMRNKSISNVTVLVGNNGSGKTTLMNNLGILTCYAQQIDETRKEYIQYSREKELLERCLYVVKENENFCVITNIKEEILTIISSKVKKLDKIFYADDITRLSNDLRNSIGLFGISSVYMTNSSYVMVGENVGTHAGIEHICFTPKSLYAVSNVFFDFISPENYSKSEITAFDKYSICLKQSMLPGKFQQLCDLYYCAGVCDAYYNNKESGLIVAPILEKTDFIVKVTSFIDLYSDFTEDKKMQAEGEEHVNILSMAKLYDCNKAKESLIYVLKANLIAEYILTDRDCKVKIEKYDGIEELYEYIYKQIIEHGDKCYINEYFKNAIREIKDFENSIIGAHHQYNTVTMTNLAYMTGFVLGRKQFIRYIALVKKCLEYNAGLALRNSGNEYGSFILRYLGVDNLYLSSGERAFQNIMSWLYWISRMGDITSMNRLYLKKNVLLCLDEVDALCHPDWKRDIIGNIIDAINDNFKEYNVQIVMSTHSPLCLSNVPSENIVYLQRNQELGIYQDDEAHEQTFCRNIYDILNDAFFLKGKTIGNYAIKYVNEIIKQIDNGGYDSLYEMKEDLYEKIDYIGDPLIRGKLLMRLDDKLYGGDSVDSRRNRLIREKERIERKLSILESEDVRD